MMAAPKPDSPRLAKLRAEIAANGKRRIFDCSHLHSARGRCPHCTPARKAARS